MVQRLQHHIVVSAHDSDEEQARSKAVTIAGRLPYQEGHHVRKVTTLGMLPYQEGCHIRSIATLSPPPISRAVLIGWHLSGF